MFDTHLDIEHFDLGFTNVQITYVGTYIPVFFFDKE